MELATEIRKFIEHPFPIWETTLTHQLVQHQWEELKSIGFSSINDYSTARVWLKNPFLELDKKKEVTENNLCIEMPSSELQSFYVKHGLELLTENEIEADAALLKLENALSILQLIKPVYDCITDLVQSIHLLRQPDAEIDLSYSHPQIPFSIFVSVCNDDSTISNLRVAESILHEAMHLKLTLIENSIPLVKPNANTLYYSPWRDEERPVRGVLHGLFVFRAIYQLYLQIIEKYKGKVKKFIASRLKDIEFDLLSLEAFCESEDLLDMGRCLTVRLLLLNP